MDTRTENNERKGAGKRDGSSFRFPLSAIRSQKGFTLLLAALVASIALALGSSIFSIVSKEIELASTGQDSQYAFYAADTAAECALYWDTRSDEHPNTFATSSGDTSSTLKNNSNQGNTVTCDSVPATSVQVVANATAATTTFEIDSLFKDVSGGYCADVSLAKSLDTQTGAENTLIIANGYNVSCSAVETAPYALQRSVELQY